MRSRELPSFRSAWFGWPEAEVEERDDHLVVRTPPGGVSASGEAWVLDEPPPDLEGWRARAGAADLLWEDRFGTGRTPPSAVCWLHDAAMDPDRPAGVRALSPDELDAAVALRVLGGTPEVVARWELRQALERVADEGAAVLATGEPGALTGLVTVAWNGREARLRGLVVHPAHRRQGLGRRLVAAAATDWQAVAFGLMYALAEPGSAMEALVREAELRPVTSVWRVQSRS